MEQLQKLVGKRIAKIFFNQDNLKFRTTDGEDFTFCVYGDCCSASLFYDFYGVKNLLAGGDVKSVEQVQLLPSDIVDGDYGKKDKKSSDSDISVYGYRITTTPPASEYGERTAVFSFRNYSNGYYGGSLEACESKEVLPEITDDVICTD